MSQDDLPSRAAPFRVVLTPYRSLSGRGFVLLMAFVGVVSFIAGVSFMAMGAWPVLGFFGLDVAIIYFAFRANYRAARAFETIAIDGGRLLLARTDAEGTCREIELNPYWTGVSLKEGADGSTRLALTSHGRAYTCGSFLSDNERRTLADALREALLAARGGARI
jgi:uncharacterized membrane protein